MTVALLEHSQHNPYRWQSKECDADKCTDAGDELAERRDWHDVAVADRCQCRLKQRSMRTIALHSPHPTKVHRQTCETSAFPCCPFRPDR